MRPAVLSVAAAFLLAGISSVPAAAQDNLKLKTIVIDAGHGGKDPGCISRDGKTKEKDIALNVALKFGALVKENYPDVNVVYTREKDVYLTLDERAQTANRNKAGLFLSIHVNAADATAAHGYSSHILGQSSKKGRDTFAGNLNVCKRENSVILLEDDYSTKHQGFDPNDPESFIFFNLMQNAYYEQSLNFAADINEMMGKKGPVSTSRGISQDPFYVLWKTTMPAVLFEMAFISNSTDLGVIRRDEGQEKIAGALLAAFSKFKEEYDSSIDLGAGTSMEKSGGTAGNSMPERPAAVRYGIQVSTSSRRLDARDPFFKKHKVTIYPSGKVYRYVVEEGGDVEKLRKMLPSVEKEFPGCYIVEIKDGTPLRLKK